MTTINLNVNGALTGTTVNATTFSGPGTGITAMPVAGFTGQVGIGNGGTGQATANAAFAALSPQTTAGDIISYTSTPTRIAVGTSGQSLRANSGATGGLSWIGPASPTINVGFTVGVAANALTVTLVQSDGLSAPSASAPCIASFRSSSVTIGGYSTVTVTSTITVTIPSGTTIGTTNNDSRFIYVYAMNNIGTVMLALSLNPFSLDTLASSTAITGGASATTLYSTAAQTSLPIQYLGKFLAPQATAGTWASAATRVYPAIGYDYAGNNAPLSVTAAFNGTGIAANLLALASLVAAGNYYGYSWTTNASGLLSSIVNTGSAHGVQFRQTQNITSQARNSGTQIAANNLVSSATFRTQTNPTVSSLNTGSGLYQFGTTGWYLLTINGAFAASAGGNVRQTLISKSDLGVPSTIQAEQSSTYLNASFGPNVCTTALIFGIGGTTSIFWEAQQDSGVTLNSCVFTCSAAFVTNG